MNPSEISDMYERLGINRNADYNEVKRVYREKSMEWHPDRNPNRSEIAHLEFIAIGEAFEKISEDKGHKIRQRQDEYGNNDFWKYEDIFRNFNPESYVKLLKDLKEYSPKLAAIFKIFTDF